MRYIRKSFIISLLMLSSNLLATIEQISSILESKKYFESSDQILGIFDIDETLLIPKDPAFQKQNLIKHPAIQKMKEALSTEQLDIVGNLSKACCPAELIEPSAPLFIKNLQAKGIRLIALTAAMTRNFGEDHLPKLRAEELLKHDIDFSYAFPEIEVLNLTNLKMCNQAHPYFYSGVLCSNGDHLRQKDASSKGKVLVEFLKQLSWLPETIIFFDDKLYNLEEMEKTLLEHHPTITFYGLHYVGAQNLVPEEISESEMEAKWNDMIEKSKLYRKEGEKDSLIECSHP